MSLKASKIEEVCDSTIVSLGACETADKRDSRAGTAKFTDMVCFAFIIRLSENSVQILTKRQGTL